jgi:DNA polymerase III delta prime subunit
MQYIPWIEKYKPNNIENFNDNLIKIFKNFEKIKNILIYGLPGTGKTTFCDLIITHFFKDHNNDNLLILNASDERGIDTVRNKIRNFCQKKITLNDSFKLVILDECDNLTYEAQTTLRRILEDFNNTKFFFICNYNYKIINPIKSRCLELEFKNFSNDYILNFSLQILEKENIILNDDLKNIYIQYIKYLILIQKNDIRKIITYIEFLSKMNPQIFDKNIINDITGHLDLDFTKQLLNQINSVRNISNTVKLLSNYSMNNILENILNIVINNDDIDYNDKKKMISLLSEIDFYKNKKVDYEIIIYKLLKEYINIK